MDRYSSSDSPPWRCNSPICISIWWPPSVGSSRSRNRARIRRTNQAAAASSANNPSQAIQLACHSLASSSRFPCPTWSLSRPASVHSAPFPCPHGHYPMARRLRQGALKSIAAWFLQKPSHTLAIVPVPDRSAAASAGVAGNLGRDGCRARSTLPTGPTLTRPSERLPSQTSLPGTLVRDAFCRD